MVFECRIMMCALSGGVIADHFLINSSRRISGEISRRLTRTTTLSDISIYFRQAQRNAIEPEPCCAPGPLRTHSCLPSISALQFLRAQLLLRTPFRHFLSHLRYMCECPCYADRCHDGGQGWGSAELNGFVIGWVSPESFWAWMERPFVSSTDVL
jgi:hypothetical protein